MSVRKLQLVFRDLCSFVLSDPWRGLEHQIRVGFVASPIRFPAAASSSLVLLLELVLVFGSLCLCV